MNGFLCRIASYRGLPSTTDADSGLGQIAFPIYLRLSQVGPSLSNSLSAPELRKEQQQQQSSPASTPPSSRASSPRSMRTAGLRPRHFQHIALSFVAGGFLTYLCICFMCATGTRLGFLSSPALPTATPAEPCTKDQRTALPSSIGLSPLALGNQTQDVHTAPDRLIVAARHSEVGEPISAGQATVSYTGPDLSEEALVSLMPSRDALQCRSAHTP